MSDVLRTFHQLCACLQQAADFKDGDLTQWLKSDERRNDFGLFLVDFIIAKQMDDVLRFLTDSTDATLVKEVARVKDQIDVSLLPQLDTNNEDNKQVFLRELSGLILLQSQPFRDMFRRTILNAICSWIAGKTVDDSMEIAADIRDQIAEAPTNFDDDKYHRCLTDIIYVSLTPESGLIGRKSVQWGTGVATYWPSSVVREHQLTHSEDVPSTPQKYPVTSEHHRDESPQKQQSVASSSDSHHEIDRPPSTPDSFSGCCALLIPLHRISD